MSQAPADRRRFRPRLSLLNLLLLTTIAALALALWRHHKQLIPLQAKIEKLQKEVGTVDVGDPRKLWVQPLDDSHDSRMHFRWRAYTPPERYGEVVLRVTAKTPEGTRQGRVTLTLDPGESNFDFTTLPSALSNPNTHWMYSLRHPLGGGGGSSFPPPAWFYAESETKLFDREGPSVSVQEGESIELLRFEGPGKDGLPMLVVLTVEHYPQGKKPNGSCSSRSRTVPDSPPTR